MIVKKNTRIFLTGHQGMLGKSILRKLKENKYNKIILITKSKLDLTNQKKVFEFFKKNKPEIVINCAARVGGILANSNYPGKFIYENTLIQSNIIEASKNYNIKKIIFFASNCIYPNNIKRKIRENDLLKSSLEKANEPYSIAKINGIKMGEAYSKQYCIDFLTLVPSTIYGPGDNYSQENSHFFPALLKKVYASKISRNKKPIHVWGTGKPKREMIFVDDVADACIFFMKKKINHQLINLGGNIFHSIKEYVKILKRNLGCNSEIIFDVTKPDGTRVKRLDNTISKSYGWKPSYTFEHGIKLSLNDFLKKK